MLNADSIRDLITLLRKASPDIRSDFDAILHRKSAEHLEVMQRRLHYLELIPAQAEAAFRHWHNSALDLLCQQHQKETEKGKVN